MNIRSLNIDDFPAYIKSKTGKITDKVASEIVSRIKYNEGENKTNGYGYFLEERYLPYRKIVSKITANNYFIQTEATFKQINKSYSFSEIEKEWDEIVKLGKHELSPKSSSEYVITKDGDVYRYSDHWGERIASCDWHLKNEKGELSGGLAIGVCNLKDFKTQEQNRYGGGGLYVAANTEFVKKYPDFVKRVIIEIEKFVQENNKNITEAGKKVFEQQKKELVQRLNSDWFLSPKKDYEQLLKLDLVENIYNKKENKMAKTKLELSTGDRILITDKNSIFKGSEATISKVKRNEFVVTVDDKGKERDVLVSKKGVKVISEGSANYTSNISSIKQTISEAQKAIKEGKVKELYDEWEDNNNHTANVFLMALQVKDDKSAKESLQMLEEQERKGDANFIYKKRDALAKKLNDKFYASLKKGNTTPILKEGDSVKMFDNEPVLKIKKVHEWSDKNPTYDVESLNGKIKRNNISADKFIYMSKDKTGKVPYSTKTIEAEQTAIQELEAQEAEIQKQIDALEEKRQAVTDKKIKLQASVTMSAAERSSTMMPWQKNLTNEEVGFVIATINRYGERGDNFIKADNENWTDFKFDYVKSALIKLKDKNEHLSELGQKLRDGLFVKMNIS